MTNSELREVSGEVPDEVVVEIYAITRHHGTLGTVSISEKTSSDLTDDTGQRHFLLEDAEHLHQVISVVAALEEEGKATTDDGLLAIQRCAERRANPGMIDAAVISDALDEAVFDVPISSAPKTREEAVTTGFCSWQEIYDCEF